MTQDPERGGLSRVRLTDLLGRVAPKRGHMNETQGGAFYAPDTRNWWQRLLARLFPAKLVDLPDDAEGFAPGYTRTDVHMHLDLRDRLRTLVSGKLRVVVVSQTDVTVAKMRSGSTFWVEAPNVEFSGVPAGHSSNHPAGGTSAGTQG